MLIAKGPSQPAPKAEKRASESIIYQLDCSELLDKNELITGVTVPKLQGVHFSDIRSRLGRLVEIRIANDLLTTAAYVDYQINVSFTTTLGNNKIAVFQLRVFK